MSVTHLSPEQESKRQWIALGICLLSTALGVSAWYLGGRAWLVLALLASVWNAAANWLGGRLGLLHKSPAQIFQTAHASGGSIFWLPPLAKTMARGGTILMVASVATCTLGP
jgi:hypothetical protein